MFKLRTTKKHSNASSSCPTSTSLLRKQHQKGVGIINHERREHVYRRRKDAVPLPVLICGRSADADLHGSDTGKALFFFFFGSAQASNKCTNKKKREINKEKKKSNSNEKKRVSFFFFLNLEKPIVERSTTHILF